MTREEAVKIIAGNTRLEPSEKRKALRMLGVETEYTPHQGKKEMARRVKRMNRIKD